MSNELKGELLKLYRRTREKPQKCYNPDCENETIRSHIQKVEGSIRNIASKGKIVELEHFTFFGKTPYGFKEKGIREKSEVLTFWGFCNSCDTKIFKDIESHDIDYMLYRNQLLYSYRGFLSEHYKQEYNIKFYDLIVKEGLQNGFPNLRYLYNQFTFSIKFGKSEKILFEKDLNENTRNFEFIYFKLPKIEVCTSTAYSLPHLIQTNYDFYTKETLPLFYSYIFINLIPDDKSLNVILGCNADENLKGRPDLSKIMSLNQSEKIKLISDILIKHVETWFVSKSLYNKWKQKGIDKEILNQINLYKPSEMKTKHIDFNMFQDIL